MTRSRLPLALGLVLLVGGAAGASAAQPFRYPEAKHGAGELRYVNGIPVLVVQGEPAEIGDQVGVLAIKPAAALFGMGQQFLQSRGWERIYPLLLTTAAGFATHFPPDHLTELEVAAKTSGQPRELLVFGNVAPDLLKFGGCSAWVVDPARSATGGPLFGRNMDWPPLGTLHEYCLVCPCNTRTPPASTSVPAPTGSASASPPKLVPA
jgi:hypothetical protein